MNMMGQWLNTEYKINSNSEAKKKSALSWDYKSKKENAELIIIIYNKEIYLRRTFDTRLKLYYKSGLVFCLFDKIKKQIENMGEVVNITSKITMVS